MILKAEKKEPGKTSVKKDIIVLIATSIAAYLISSFFDIFEKFIEFSKKYEEYEIDEILIVLVLLSFFLSIFSIRRITELKKEVKKRSLAEIRISENLKEKEVLLRELNHRVKNNFQLIMSLLSLQKHTLKDETLISIFETSENRIRTISQIYDMLNQSEDMGSIEFDEFLKTLLNEYNSIRSAWGSKIPIYIDVEKLKLNLNQSIPCGLIINELTLNSLKHAFTPEHQKSAYIKISMKSENDMFYLKISDNGKGIEKNTKIETKSLGIQLVEALTKQLKGEISWNSSGGTSCTIVFPR